MDSAELSDGYVFRFRFGESMLEDLAKIIELERQCCPFLNFRLTIDAGADGTKEIIESLFNWS